MRRSWCSSFTLLEILIVIAIVSVLAALMLPATQRVKQSADATKCINNLRQVGLAVNMYGEDYRTYPWGLDNPTTAWSYSINSVLGATNGNTFAALPNSRSKVIECPSRIYKPSTTVPCYALHWRIFGQSDLGFFQTATFPRAYPFTQRPAEIIMAADVDQDRTGNGGEAWACLYVAGMLDEYDPATAGNAVSPGDNYDDTPGDLRWRHMGNTSANFLFMDGHIASMLTSGLQERHIKITGP